ncbi:MAG: hypothetical protein NC132_05540 [Corallococcus sp.]|nr:hypothetical protein [Corallococcus sp.]MCM1359999.1 hypothetical protein [Corallococcus sp.]MCM1395556.1 hypothetical protein [Corallococcus sp.]
MADSVKIQIELANGSDGMLSELVGLKNSTAQDNAKAFFALDKAVSVGKQLATQVVNRHVASIGSKTGNYVLQERVQSGLNVVSKLVSTGIAFAVNPVLGFLTAIKDGADFAFDIAERNREIMWQNRAANELARRAGYLSNQNR